MFVPIFLSFIILRRFLLPVAAAILPALLLPGMSRADERAFTPGLYGRSAVFPANNTISPIALRADLDSRGYRAVAEPPRQTGEFSVQGDTFHILVREFLDEEGTAYPKLNLIIHTASGRIENPLGTVPDALRLEPQLLSSFEPEKSNPDYAAVLNAAAQDLKNAAQLRVFTTIIPPAQQCALDALKTESGPPAALIALELRGRTVAAWAERPAANSKAPLLATKELHGGGPQIPFIVLAALDRAFSGANSYGPLDLLPVEPEAAPPATDPQSPGPEDQARSEDGAVLRARLNETAPSASAPAMNFRNAVEILSAPDLDRLAKKIGATQLRALTSRVLPASPTLLTLAGGTAALPGAGRFAAARYLSGAVDSSGAVTPFPESNMIQIADPAAAFVATDMFRGTLNGGAAARARSAGSSWDAGAFVGASPDHHDVWIVGFAPNVLVAAIMSDPNAELPLDGAAPPWTAFLNCLTAKFPPARFAAPAGIRFTQIDRTTFQPATTACPESSIESVAIRATDPLPPRCQLHSRGGRWQQPSYQQERNTYPQERSTVPQGRNSLPEPSARPDGQWQQPDRPAQQRRRSTTLDSVWSTFRRGANNLWRR